MTLSLLWSPSGHEPYGQKHHNSGKIKWDLRTGHTHIQWTHCWKMDQDKRSHLSSVVGDRWVSCSATSKVQVPGAPRAIFGSSAEDATCTYQNHTFFCEQASLQMCKRDIPNTKTSHWHSQWILLTGWSPSSHWKLAVVLHLTTWIQGRKPSWGLDLADPGGCSERQLPTRRRSRETSKQEMKSWKKKTNGQILKQTWVVYHTKVSKISFPTSPF